MKIINYAIIAVAILSLSASFSQVGIGTNNPEPSAILDLKSSTKGFLPPRMSTIQRNAINGGVVAAGLTIFNTDSNCLEFWDGTIWFNVCGDNAIPAGSILISDNFQDGVGNSPFNLQVRNTTATATEWQAVIYNKPYSVIPGLVAGYYTVSRLDNSDGSYTYIFTGTTPLAAYQGITIIGNMPSPAGNNSDLSLFIP
jgi:hypothetical protein